MSWYLFGVDCGAIAWTHAGQNCGEIWIKIANIFFLFVQEIAFENVVCKIAAILLRSQCGNDYNIYANDCNNHRDE